MGSIFSGNKGSQQGTGGQTIGDMMEAVFGQGSQQEGPASNDSAIETFKTFFAALQDDRGRENRLRGNFGRTLQQSGFFDPSKETRGGKPSVDAATQITKPATRPTAPRTSANPSLLADDTESRGGTN